MYFFVLLLSELEMIGLFYNTQVLPLKGFE